MYRANMFLRTAVRILKAIKSFEATNEDQLYRQMMNIPWEKIMGIHQTFAIDAVVGSHFFRHSKYVALKTKDALADRFRNKKGKRPSVDPKDPDIRIHVNIQGKLVRVYLDSSGDSLHLRGYKKALTEAPLSEILAAGMIKLSGWDMKTPFMDPMCGSGTLSIEASLMATDTAPGLFRTAFGFQFWNNYDDKMWKRVKEEAMDRQKPLEIPIHASDVSPKAVRIAKRNLEGADLLDQVEISVIKYQSVEVPETPGWMLINPPYGERLAQHEINDFYKTIGDRMKQDFKGWQAWIISSNFEAMKKIGLKPLKRINLFNGPLACKFQGYDLY